MGLIPSESVSDGHSKILSAIKPLSLGRVCTTLLCCKEADISYRDETKTVFELPGGLGGLNPPTSPGRPPYLWSKFDPWGLEFQPPHLSFAEVGMLLDSHFLLMQFLKYLQGDDLNVTTILIH